MFDRLTYVRRSSYYFLRINRAITATISIPI
nr:MAG TPA: hypothetical protein [Caudoviricetes sp.]